MPTPRRTSARTSKRILVRSILALPLLLALAPLSPHDVAASTDCRAAAARAAQQSGGRVLSARPVGGGACEVTLLVPQAGGPPRRVVTTVTAMLDASPVGPLANGTGWLG